jgi:hypothetical protein
MRQDPEKETEQAQLTLLVLAAVVTVLTNVFILVKVYLATPL